MATASGTVTWLKVNNDDEVGQNFGFVGLVPTGDTASTLYILWWNLVSVESTPTAADWVLRNMHVSVLRDAYLNKSPVTLTFDDGTVNVTSVQIGIDA
jgi:hypothetical protein